MITNLSKRIFNPLYLLIIFILFKLYWHKLKISNYITKLIMIDFSSFDKILIHLKLQTCFVLPGLFSANIINFEILVQRIQIMPIESYLN